MDTNALVESIDRVSVAAKMAHTNASLAVVVATRLADDRPLEREHWNRIAEDLRTFEELTYKLDMGLICERARESGAALGQG
jgi:hypothetical protein